jgi:NADH:ubiquinone oxidoreductase subunit 3 (subunit A)
MKYFLSSDSLSSIPNVPSTSVSLQYLFAEWYLTFIFLIVSFVLSCLIFGISYILSARSADKEKVSAYECGFNPFEDARNQFDVRFYLVAILFIIFDLEVSFLFP